MLNIDQNNDFVRNTFAGNGIDASVVVGRAHRTSPGHKTGKRLRAAYLPTPTVVPRTDSVSVPEPASQERWCRRQRQAMSGCCMAAGAQAPAAMWASLILANQRQTTL